MQQMIFVADLIACSTCFGHHYAHHHELECYTVGCCLWYLVLWFSSCRFGVVYNTLELMMMGIVVPETC